MTQLATGLSTVNRACLAACQGGVYYTNGFDPVKVWYGLTTTLLDAGITGPTLAIGTPTTAAGGLSNGDHLIRYRYKNTSTGYVSNPSPALTYTVSAGNGLLTYGIGVADDIRTTSDTKVDQYVIEATRVGGGVFYQLGTAAVGLTSVQVGMSDDALAQQFNSDDEYGSSEDLETYSAEIPPLGTILVPYRGRMWVIGDAAYPLTGVTFTATSTTVSGTGFSLRWAGRVILKAGDTTAYEIASVTNSTTLVLARAYGGSTSTTTAQVISKFPNRGYYSRLFYPEQFFTNVWARDFLANRSDQVVAALGRKDGLYIFGRYSAERLVFDSDPSAVGGAALSPLQGRRGCFQQRCLVDVEGEFYAWDRQGMWIVGETPKHISVPIDLLLEEYINYDENTQFHASYDPASRCVIFFFVQAGESSEGPRMAACFEINTGRWFFNRWLQGITASSIVPTTDGQVRLMLGDINGYSWYYGINGSFDGVPSNFPTVVTVTGSPSTTNVPVTATLPTTSPDFRGCIAYNPLTGDYGYMGANTASALTLPVGFAVAPTAGQELYLGPIPFEYRTKWWVAQGQELLKNPVYLCVKLFPGADTGTMRIYFYADFETSPTTVTANVDDDWPDGVTVGNGNGYIEVNLDGGDGDGVLSVPVPVEWKNAIQARLTSIRPDGDLRILDAQFVLKKAGIINDLGT